MCEGKLTLPCVRAFCFLVAVLAFFFLVCSSLSPLNSETSVRCLYTYLPNHADVFGFQR